MTLDEILAEAEQNGYMRGAHQEDDVVKKKRSIRAE
jgi:hypothetical protein